MTKDWIGNKTTTFVQLGASNHTDKERENNDYYATDPDTVTKLLEVLKRDGIELNKNIYEPACGEGHISKVLEKEGYLVTSSDLIDRGYGEVKDFLNSSKRYVVGGEDIITNPPYKYAKEFVEKALEVSDNGDKIIMLLKIQFLEGKARRKLFEKYPPKYVYVHSERQTCYINGNIDKKMSSASCYCWYIWKKGEYTEPIIRWI